MTPNKDWAKQAWMDWCDLTHGYQRDYIGNKMTIRRAEFKAVADILKPYRYDGNPYVVSSVRHIAEGLALYFKQNNPAFDREKFMRACGWYNEV